MFSTKDYHTLRDISSSGKEINWNYKKEMSLKVSESMKRIDKRYGGLSPFGRRSDSISSCGNDLVFGITHSGRLLLTHANFCRDRLCPMCTWRKSLKQFGQTSKLMDYIDKLGEKYRYLFLTLTVENCLASNLKLIIKDMLHGYGLLLKRKEVKKAVVGSCRHIETTYNFDETSKSFDTYHPHIHAILMVKPSYFENNYISQSKWTDLWASCMNINYKPMVHIETVKESEQAQAIAELSKYPIKIDSLLGLANLNIDYCTELFDNAIETLGIALSNFRLVEYYGLMREYRKKLQLEDVENGDLISTDIIDIREDLTGVILRYKWFNGYKLVF
jgi:plasmid rolling circle replication initiator protein Rep